ncbi:hypothetical protein LEN26_015170 [Aphanomyces euteiches]|nr:hypothetical protein AeMF1_020459 [Aphanomyces euteiches]KAH9103901.1 hypothetical protein LEN26_015170 [Aphanomyces euteiches]KAH9181143.1 hypothetical protein AeNC1_016880 [Aphanomyces euteiches]
MRRSMTFPFESLQDDAFGYMIKMPASLFYGTGMRSFVLSFLAANETTRKQDVKPLQFCQQGCLFGMPVVDLCVWIDQIEETNANSTQYMVYAASLIHESNVSIWLRFTFRCFVSIYVLYRLWTNYYAHYRPLLTNLSSLGLSKDYRRYEIVLGDPAYAILSDPVVSFVMVLDIWWSVSYVTIAVIRVSQLQDIIVNINGCLYLSRCVWLAYLGMRTMASVVKWRCWEASFACVDPGLLAILAYIYCGPIIALFGTTRLVFIYYVLWNIGLSSDLHGHGVEAITVVVFFTVLMETLPLPYSRLMAWWHHRKNRITPFYPRKLKNNSSHYTYNDMKALP